DKLDGLDSTQFARRGSPSWSLIAGTTPTTVLAPGKFVCYDPDASAGSGSTFDECWQNYGPLYSPAAYTKDAFGFVHLKGLVKCVPASSTSFGTRECEATTPNNVIFVLPSGFLPAEISLFPNVTANQAGRITIY